MSKQIVAVDQEKDGHYVTATLVAINGSWATVMIDGEEVKVRKGQLAMEEDGVIEELLSDEDDNKTPDTKDVFPDGYRESYTRNKVGSTTRIDCGDQLAEQLRGMGLAQVADMASKVLGQRSAKGWIAFYTTDREANGQKPLNQGMVRMNLGNRLRAHERRLAEEARALVA